MGISEGEVFVGIDVAKKTLDVHVLPHARDFTVPNDPAGVQQLVDELRTLRPTLVVLEATGGLQLRAAAQMAAAGLAVAVVNPRQVRDFARSIGLLAKTDRLDAQAIARFAAAVRPEPRPLPDEQRRALTDLVTRRRQLVDMRVAEKLRRSAVAPRLQGRLDEHLDWLAQAIAELDQQIQDAVRSSELWHDEAALIRSVPGVGPQTAATLIAHLPELGHIAAAKLAALVGLAPFNNDSGQSRGRRSIRGGRAVVRTALYMATTTATRCNPVIRAYHQRLLNTGKPRKVATVAAMHKLLRILHAIIASKTPWRTT